MAAQQLPSSAAPVGRTARLMIGLIRLYQLTLSPWIGRDCRYLPTCSAYASEAITQHGALAGMWLAARRIVRCNPWGGHGFDPVPAPGQAGRTVGDPSSIRNVGETRSNTEART